MPPRTVAYSNALFEFKIPPHNELNKFSFMYEIKNSWTIQELYTEIGRFIRKTNFEYYLNVPFVIYYQGYALSRVSQTRIGRLDNFSAYPQFGVRKA